ncbi:MAG: thiamine phosphate synthase, partial [Chromatiaceae bacterium]
VGASCHSAAELARAAALGLDYALLSPVKPTASHPETQALGWDGFAALTDPVPLPVYALGGLDPTDLGDAIHHGAQGIAAIRGLWPE